MLRRKVIASSWWNSPALVLALTRVSKYRTETFQPVANTVTQIPAGSGTYLALIRSKPIKRVTIKSVPVAQPVERSARDA